MAVTREGIVNFYPEDAVNPYVALAARGPWIVTSKGAVLHDSGGYGMLGLGHAPERRPRRLAQPPGDGQRHDAQLQPAAARPGAAARDRPQPRRAAAPSRASSS